MSSFSFSAADRQAFEPCYTLGNPKLSILYTKWTKQWIIVRVYKKQVKTSYE